MGFTPHQARIALASTDTGLDVDQALETLLANTEESQDINVEARDLDRTTPPRRSAVPVFDRGREPEYPIRRQDLSPSANPQYQAYQEHADKIISQATVIGRGMFNRANALWKEGKDRVQKVYEERQAQQAGISRAGNGRPKWMVEEREREEAASESVRSREARQRGREEAGFRDDEDSGDEPLVEKPENAEREIPGKCYQLCIHEI